MLKNRLLGILVMFLGGLFFGGINVFAESIGNMDSMMTISPPDQRIVLIPGEIFEGTIKVSNPAEAKQDLEYSVLVGSFNLGRNENGEIDYNDTDTDTITGYNQMMEWIVLGKESGTVAPNMTDTVPFKIVVPADAPAGGQYATIIIQDDTKDKSGGNGNVSIQNVIRFASKIFAEVTGETREVGAIIENNIPAFSFNNVLSTTATVKNEGNVHTYAKFVLQVWPLFSDEEFCTNEEEPGTSLIMPDTERLHVEECSLPAIGIFRAKQTVSIFGETSVTEKTVVVCPMWLLFLIIFAIALLIIWIIAKAKAGKKREA